MKVTINTKGRALSCMYVPEERQITTREQCLDEQSATLVAGFIRTEFRKRFHGSHNTLNVLPNSLSYGSLFWYEREASNEVTMIHRRRICPNQTYSEKTAEY
jgi:hypothetical protein